MIDTNIWKAGATSIRVEVSVWKSDRVTPDKFRCTITHDSHSPSAFTAERDNALAAERECVESFLAYFGKKDRKVSAGTKALRNTAPADKKEPTKKPVRKVDDFDY